MDLLNSSHNLLCVCVFVIRVLLRHNNYWSVLVFHLLSYCIVAYTCTVVESDYCCYYK